MDGYVLLVEDNEDIREMMSLALQLAGARVVCASNGLEALSILKDRRPPDIILLDLMMPVMNGWEFVESLAKDAGWSRIPVVVVTAFAERAKGIQAQEVLKKPIGLDALLGVAKRYCEPH